MRQVRSLKRQAGFWNFVIPAAAAWLGYEGTKNTNQSNQAISAATMAFNAQEAEKNRVFSAGQADLAYQRNVAEASSNRSFQAGQAGAAMNFAERMAATSYQRAVGDLAKAGLNPMLAYSQGGAPSPQGTAGHGAQAQATPASGSQASYGNYARQESTAIAALNSAAASINLRNAIKQGENIEADTILKQSQANREVASAGNLNMSTMAIQESIPKIKAEADHLRAQTGTEIWKQTVMEVEKNLKQLEAMVRAEEISLVEAQTQLTKIKTVLAHLAEPEARNAANAQDSWWMRNVSPYLPDLLKSTGAAGGIRGLAR